MRVCTPTLAWQAPGSPGDEAHPGIARQLAVRFGHICRAGFMPTGHVTDALRIVNSVEYLEVALARNAESRVDTMRFQCVDEDSSASSSV